MHGLTFSLSFRFHPNVLEALAYYIERGDYRPNAMA